jgi:hypothetical protein
MIQKLKNDSVSITLYLMAEWNVLISEYSCSIFICKVIIWKAIDIGEKLERSC